MFSVLKVKILLKLIITGEVLIIPSLYIKKSFLIKSNVQVRHCIYTIFNILFTSHIFYYLTTRILLH